MVEVGLTAPPKCFGAMTVEVGPDDSTVGPATAPEPRPRRAPGRERGRPMDREGPRTDAGDVASSRHTPLPCTVSGARTTAARHWPSTFTETGVPGGSTPDGESISVVPENRPAMTTG
jgi:hypothetical protein